MKITKTNIFPHHWEKVVEVLLDPEFNVEIEKLRDGVISTEFKMIRDEEREKLFELRTTEYKRKKTGGIDRSGTVQTFTTSRYDASSKRLEWEYHGEGGKMMVIKGVYSVTPMGESPLGDDQARFTHEVTIEVKIPIIGNSIARMIARGFENEDPRYKTVWEKYLGE